jgi:hypothetical protein
MSDHQPSLVHLIAVDSDDAGQIHVSQIAFDRHAIVSSVGLAG